MGINKTLSVFALACSVFSSVSFAEKYQFAGMVGVSKDTLEIPSYFPDADLELQNDFVLLGVKAYAQAVDTKKGPLAEAEFLSKSSFMSMLAMSAESEATLESDSFSQTFEGPSLSAVLFGGRLVRPHAGRAMIFEGHIGAGDIKSMGFGMGTYLTDSQTVKFNYDQDEVDDTEMETNTLSVELKGVQNLNNGTFVAADLTVARQTEDADNNSGDNDVTNFFTTSADYYFNRQLSVGATVGIFTGDSDGKIFGIQGSFFPVESVGINAYFTKQSEDDFDVSEQVLGLELEVRI